MNKLIKKCQAGSAINNGIDSSYNRYLKRRAVNDMIAGSGGRADSIDDYQNPVTGENIFSQSQYNWLQDNNGFNSKGKLKHGALRRMNKHLNNPEYQSMFGGIYGAQPSTSTFNTSSFLTDRDDIKLNYNFTPQSVTDSYIESLRKPWTEVTATPPVQNPYTTNVGPVVAPGTQQEITAETPVTPVTRTSSPTSTYTQKQIKVDTTTAAKKADAQKVAQEKQAAPIRRQQDTDSSWKWEWGTRSKTVDASKGKTKGVSKDSKPKSNNTQNYTTPEDNTATAIGKAYLSSASVVPIVSFIRGIFDGKRIKGYPDRFSEAYHNIPEAYKRTWNEVVVPATKWAWENNIYTI